MAAPLTAQVVLGLAVALGLHHQLERTGVSGQENILRQQQTGDPMQRFAPFFVGVQGQPDHTGFPFQCSCTAWIDTSKPVLMEGPRFLSCDSMCRRNGPFCVSRQN